MYKHGSHPLWLCHWPFSDRREWQQCQSHSLVRWWLELITKQQVWCTNVKMLISDEGKCHITVYICMVCVCVCVCVCLWVSDKMWCIFFFILYALLWFLWSLQCCVAKDQFLSGNGPHGPYVLGFFFLSFGFFVSKGDFPNMISRMCWK